MPRAEGTMRREFASAMYTAVLGSRSPVARPARRRMKKSAEMTPETAPLTITILRRKSATGVLVLNMSRRMTRRNQCQHQHPLRIWGCLGWTLAISCRTVAINSTTGYRSKFVTRRNTKYPANWPFTLLLLVALPCESSLSGRTYHRQHTLIQQL